MHFFPLSMMSFVLCLSEKSESVSTNIWNQVIYQGGAILWQLAQRSVTDAAADEHGTETKPFLQFVTQFPHQQSCSLCAWTTNICKHRVW